ncbi:MAG TPA: ElyC/SanA/YdcF family protein [Bacteroidia bacterium]|jgi:SanA protein|nr:ElyC/SanA/YdcF family protein [Bacteroidia bacterium]
MSTSRLLIVLILLLIVVFIVWRLQKFRVPRVITRWVLLPLIILFFIFSMISSRLVNKAAENKIYSDINLIPYRETALVLGANKNSAPLFFFNRIDAAVILFKAGKIKNIIVSGADGPDNYDEAADMKSALIVKGVPDSIIVMDKEGNNTLSSIVRCKEIYGKNKIIVVSQSYHVSRAIYIASKNGIDAIGFFTGDFGGKRFPPKEYLSRIKAVFFQ